MDTKEIQDYTGNQQKLIDTCIVPGFHVRKLKLLHCVRSVRSGSRVKTNLSPSIYVLLNDVIVVFLVSSSI